MKRNRVAVTLSPAVRIALDMQAERTGLPRSAQAQVLLRQALHQTINSAECKRRLEMHTAQRTHAEWIEDTTNDRATELEYEQAQKCAAFETEADNTGSVSFPGEAT